MRHLAQSFVWLILVLAAFPQAAQARNYEPSTGRWMQRDPMGISPTITMFSHNPPTYALMASGVDPRLAYQDGSNLYQYVRSRPVVWVDPVGMQGSPVDEYFEGSPRFNETEKNLWKRLGLVDKLWMRNAYNTAIRSVSGPEYDGTRHNGPGDAVRHCVFSCEMSRGVGETTANKWGDAHEESSTNPEETGMDLHNNDAGRHMLDDFDRKFRIKKDGLGFCREAIPFSDPSYNGECLRRCKKALNDGKLKTLPEDKWN